MLHFKIDKERCIQCGLCRTDCPAQCIEMAEGTYPTLPEEDNCIQCQHCLAVCPTGALSILKIDPDESLQLKNSWPSVKSLEILIKGRRSVRNYKPESVDAATIQSLLETAWHAPTGTNAQSVLFTATLTAEVTNTLREKIYVKLNQLIAKKDPESDNLALKYLRMADQAYREHGIDVVLRGAPHILIASASETVPLPKEDCLIALTTFDLLAHSAGLGTLWDGILTWSLTDFFPELAAELGVPTDHKIGYCMLFGKPAVTYQRTVQRNPSSINLIQSL